MGFGDGDDLGALNERVRKAGGLPVVQKCKPDELRSKEFSSCTVLLLFLCN
jgi:hypothetical protein